MRNSQGRREPVQFVRRSVALPGVNHYLFCSGCQRASLWLWPSPHHPSGRPGAARQPLPAGVIELAPAGAGAALVLVLPVGWAGGLPEPASAPPLEMLTAAGAGCVGLRQLPAGRAPGISDLARLWQDYRRLACGELASAEALQALRLERRLRWRFAPGCLEPALLRGPWPLDRWLDALPQAPGTVADDVVELLQLLDGAERAEVGRALAGRIRARLGAEGGAGDDRQPLLELLAALVGGTRSGAPNLPAAAAAELRGLGLQQAVSLEDPASRGLALAPLLGGEPGATRQALGPLVAAIDALALSSEQARDAGDQAGHRRLNGVLSAILLSASARPSLLGTLLLALQAETLQLLGSLPQPAVSLPLLRAVLSLDSPRVNALDEPGRRALVNLAERILPRIWWQRSLLLDLHEALRHQPLELAWLWEHSVLLKGLERLHSRGSGPQALGDGQSEPWPQPHELEATGLLRAQVLVLLHLFPQPHPQAGRLLRLAGSAGKPPVLRLLDGEDEEALLMAATAGLASRTLLLCRLSAERMGVAELLPPLLRQGPLVEAFRHTLGHWRGHFGASAGLARAPVAVVISTRADRHELLRLALESLSLQTLWPEEVWVLDDGTSEQGSAELGRLVALCRRRLNLPLRLLRSGSQEGTRHWRDLALRITQAEVVAFQTPDALSHPLRLARQWRRLQRGSRAVRTRHLSLEPTTSALRPDGHGGRFFGDALSTLMVERSLAWEQGGIQQELAAGGSSLLNQPLCLMPAPRVGNGAPDRPPL